MKFFIFKHSEKLYMLYITHINIQHIRSQKSYKINNLFQYLAYTPPKVI